MGLPRWLSDKESASQAGDSGLVPGKWQLTPVFMPGKSHGQRSLAGYSPWDWKVRQNLATKPPSPPTPYTCMCVYMCVYIHIHTLHAT